MAKNRICAGSGIAIDQPLSRNLPGEGPWPPDIQTSRRESRRHVGARIRGVAITVGDPNSSGTFGGWPYGFDAESIPLQTGFRTGGGQFTAVKRRCRPSPERPSGVPGFGCLGEVSQLWLRLASGVCAQECAQLRPAYPHPHWLDARGPIKTKLKMKGKVVDTVQNNDKTTTYKARASAEGDTWVRCK